MTHVDSWPFIDNVGFRLERKRLTQNQQTNMNQGFKVFLLEDAKKWTESSKAKILHMLKHDSEQLKINVNNNLLDWGTQYCFKEGKELRCTGDEADELMEGWRELFKDELEAME